MDLEQAKTLIKKHIDGHQVFVSKAKTGLSYYRNDNDIRKTGLFESTRTSVEIQKNPLRNADNRISHNWHQLLVNQKASYLFTDAPTFDTGKDDCNKKIGDILGERFNKEVKDLCVEASNTGVAWLHCWVKEDGTFCFGDVPSSEIVPVYSDTLDEELEAVLRYYLIRDDSGKDKTRYEIWTDKECSMFERAGENDVTYCNFNGIPGNVISHKMGYVPFIPFYNNGTHTSDLDMYKDLIDQYDKVTSGFANDLEDIQEVIFVIRNYGGEDLGTFLSELKRYKAIKVEGDSNSTGGGVETMKIEIPVEARVKFLEIIKKQIFISGQGVDPDPQSFGNSSGVALRYLYSLLEIKAGLLETEFRAGFQRFLKMVCHHLNIAVETPITQTFYRNMIENDVENADIASNSTGIVSEKTILKNHPWVEDAEAEQEQLEKEQGEADNYGKTVGV